MITCSVCGKQNPDGTQYCEDCGAELTVAPAAPVPVEATPAAPVEAAPEAPAAPAAEVAPAPEAAPAPAPEAAPAEVAPETPVAEATPAPAPEAAPTPEPAPVVVPPVPAPAPAFRPGKLTVKRFGSLTSDVIPMQGAKLTVGRFDASTGPVEIDLSSLAGAENISRRHAEIFYDGVWKVKDLGSTNGVFLKKVGESAFSARLVEPTALSNGDELAFGNIVVVFEEA